MERVIKFIDEMVGCCVKDEEITSKFELGLDPKNFVLSFMSKDSDEMHHLHLDNFLSYYLEGTTCEEMMPKIKETILHDAKKYAKSISFNDVKANLMPVLKPANFTTLPLPNKAFAKNSGLSIYYVMDDDGKMIFVKDSHLKKWDITLDELHDTAIRNIKKVAGLPKQIRNFTETMFIYDTLDGYDASRILSLDVDEIKKVFKGDVCVGIPNRDFMIVFDEKSPMKNNFLNQIKNDYNVKNYPISPKAFVLRGSVWRML